MSRPIDIRKYSAQDSIPQSKQEQRERYQQLVEQHMNCGGKIRQIPVGESGATYPENRAQVARRIKAAQEQEARAALARFEMEGV